MEQKELVHKLFSLSVTTLRKFCEIMLTIQGAVQDKLNEDKPIYGKTSLYKLLNSQDPTTKTLLDQKVDLNRMQAYLAQHGLPFAFKTQKEGTHLYFRVKDERLLTKVINDMTKDLIKDPQGFAKKVLKKPDAMSFEEKLAYSKQSSFKGELPEAPTFKAPRKGL